MLFSTAVSLVDMEHLYHGAYRPGTVDLDTSGAADYEALRRNTNSQSAGVASRGKLLVGFWPLDGDGMDTSELHMADSCSNYEADGAGNEVSHCPGLDAFNAEFVVGLFGQAFHFTSNDHLEVRLAWGVGACHYGPI